MLVIEVRFLTGRYAASHYNDRQRAEWPPHPGRVYSALVAALHDDPEPTADERRALQWLAEAPPPDLIASDAGERKQSTVFVPTNDAVALPDIDGHILALQQAEDLAAAATGQAKPKAAKALANASEKLRERSDASTVADGRGTPSNAAAVLPPGRSRQPRTFPVAVPHEDVVHLRFSLPAPPEVAEALDRVACRVSSLGHSSSLVSVRVLQADVDVGDRTRWTPDAAGDLILRVPTPGQLERLEEAHARHLQILPRITPTGFATYGDSAHGADVDLPQTPFTDRWIVFEAVAPPDGRRRLLDFSLAQHVARALRGTLLGAADGGWPESLSGHSADATPSQRPHLAFVPLGDVGHGYATGSILGVALIPPRDLSSADREMLLDALGQIEAKAREQDTTGDPPSIRLVLGRHGTVHVRRLRDVAHAKTLQESRWTRPARRWATATAVALGRNPGNLRSRDPDVVARAVESAEVTIATACVNLGLPAPAAVWIHRRSLLEGAPAAEWFMPFPTAGDSPRRVCVHAEVLFHEPIRGPLLLGAGRYLGLGLCLPLEER